MSKLYIVGPENGGAGAYQLVADTGESLASHFCSDRSYARGDLESARPERQAVWRERFGLYYRVLFLGEDEMTLEELKRRNAEWAKAQNVPHGAAGDGELRPL